MRETTDIPKFDHYKSSRDETTNRVFQYFMVGTFGAVTAMGAKATVQGESNLKSKRFGGVVVAVYNSTFAS